jgi:hypothetical protein
MLVGFWENGSTAPTPALECTLPARRLADVPEEALEAALGRAKAPTAAHQRRPFFDDAGPPRPSGSGGEY